MKKGGKRILKCEFEIRTNTKIFEKKPNKGGTPANDRITSEIILVRIWVDPKFDKENRVLILVPTDCSTDVNKRNDVKL